MNLIDKIREALGRLADLTADELVALRKDIAKCAKDVPETASAETTALLNELADGMQAVADRSNAMKAEAQQAEADATAARERIAQIDGSDAPEGDAPEGGEPAPDAPTEDEDEEAKAKAKAIAEGGEEAPVEGEPVAVAASGTPRATPGRMANGGRPSTAGVERPSAGTALVATGALAHFGQGERIPDRDTLGAAMAETLVQMDPRGAGRGVVKIARADYRDQFPEDRRLSLRDPIGSRKKIDNVAAPRALVATGGTCAPVNVDWSIETWAVADRPIRDGLPAFQADRGGLILRTPPDIAALSGATAVWTEATDADPMGATKPVLVIDCPDDTTTYVDAISTRLGFGNMQSMFDPETVAANTDLAIAAAAQVAELNLLAKIEAYAVADITTAAVFGAARTFFTTLDRAVAAYRDLHRLSDTQSMCVILPRWMRDLIRADRVLEFAHDTGSVDAFGVTNEWIDSQMALRHVNPIWTLDGQPTPGGAFPNQFFAAFAASSGAPQSPQKVVWYLFAEGALQFLDSGRLDLGVVRDSTLDATNDYETFVETFEGVANRIFTGGVLQFVTTICVNGESAAGATSGTCL